MPTKKNAPQPPRNTRNANHRKNPKFFHSPTDVQPREQPVLLGTCNKSTGGDVCLPTRRFRSGMIGATCGSVGGGKQFPARSQAPIVCTELGCTTAPTTTTTITTTSTTSTTSNPRRRPRAAPSTTTQVSWPGLVRTLLLVVVGGWGGRSGRVR